MIYSAYLRASIMLRNTHFKIQTDRRRRKTPRSIDGFQTPFPKQKCLCWDALYFFGDA